MFLDPAFVVEKITISEAKDRLIDLRAQIKCDFRIDFRIQEANCSDQGLGPFL